MTALTVRRLRELAALVAIGDGVVGALAPRRHTLLWLDGPRPYRAAMAPFVRRPGVTRLLSTVQIALGLWIASRQWPRGGASAG